jgi:hypothetical protein
MDGHHIPIMRYFMRSVQRTREIKEQRHSPSARPVRTNQQDSSFGTSNVSTVSNKLVCHVIETYLQNHETQRKMEGNRHIFLLTCYIKFI